VVPQTPSPVGRAKSGLLYPYRTPTRRLQPLRYREGVLFRDVDTSADEVGHVCLTAFPADRELYIDYFEVAAAFRGQGYGREMYQWVEGYARRRGMRQILLTPYDSALPFWLRMGFRVISTETYEMMKPLR
jgi:GNAT superfamily N-acetyltransferase